VAELTLRARGPARPEVVWRRYAEPSRWPSWSPQVRRVDYSHARLVARTRGRVHGPWLLSVSFRIDAVDEPRRTWSWTVWPQLAGHTVTLMHLSHGVVPVSSAHDRTTPRPQAESGVSPSTAGPGVARSTTTWLRLRAPGPVLALYAPVAWLALRRLVR